MEYHTNGDYHTDMYLASCHREESSTYTMFARDRLPLRPDIPMDVQNL